MTNDGYIVFCTVVKALRGHLTTDNVLSVLDKVWAWTQTTTEQAPNAPSAPPSSDMKTARITVKTLELRKEGESNGRKWKRYLITDTNDGKWGTFHQNTQTGVTYHIEYTENESGRTIKKLTKIKADYDDEDEDIPF